MTTELKSILRWYEYNSYARKRYLKAIFDRIPSRVRYSESCASFPTIVQIFLHVLDAYRWWFIYVYEDRVKEYERHRDKRRTRREVEAEEKEVDSLVMAFVRRLREKDLDRVIRWKDGRDIRKDRLGDILLHMVEEELQHRGEINALFWQHDTNPPIVQFHDWIRRTRS
ncbi:MAG: DinB family protein [Nitrososphaerota archaeon]|nr:DinB family protein [Nitrososphaerota archaeon]